MKTSLQRRLDKLEKQIEKHKSQTMNNNDPMTPDRYQQLAARTLVSSIDFPITDDNMRLVWNVIGLTGEAGEMAEQIKKGVFHQHGVDREKLIDEAGDVLWYLSAILTVLNVPRVDTASECDEQRLERVCSYAILATKELADGLRQD